MSIYTCFKARIGNTEVQKTNLESIITNISSDMYMNDVLQLRPLEKNKRTELKKVCLGMFYPGIIFSRFSDFKLNDSVEASGVIQFDFDVDDKNLDFRIEKSLELQQRVNSLESTLYSFLSPSGGLKFGILSDFACADMSIIKESFKCAYYIAKKYLEDSGIDVVLDDSVSSVLKGCYTSYDENAYLNTSATKVILNDKAHAKRREQSAARVEEELNRVSNFKPSETCEKEVFEALRCIDPGLRYNASVQGAGKKGRFEINAAVISALGSSAENVLMNHWEHSDPELLRSQIRTTIKEISKDSRISVGTLFREATKYHGWQRKKTTGTHVELVKTEEKGSFEFERVNRKQATTVLNEAISDYFNKKRNKIILVDAGLGKSTTMIDVIVKLNGALKLGSKIAIFVPGFDLGYQTKDQILEGLGIKQNKNVMFSNKVGVVQGQNRICRMKTEDLKYYEDVIIDLGTEACTFCKYGKDYVETGLYSECDYIKQYSTELL